MIDRSELDELLEYYEDCIKCIRFWHAVGHDQKQEIILWALYQNSPEMKRINKAKLRIEEMIREQRRSR